MDENAVLRALPCLECQQIPAAMRVRARLGAIVLMAQRGEPLPALSIDDLLRGCCKKIDEAGFRVVLRDDGDVSFSGSKIGR